MEAVVTGAESSIMHAVIIAGGLGICTVAIGRGVQREV